MLKFLCAITGVLLAAALTIDTAEAKSPEVAPIEGVPTLMTGTYDVAKLGYTTNEYFVSGVANSYSAPQPLASDGRWTARVSGTAPYRTRIVVMRPTSGMTVDRVALDWWLLFTAVQACVIWTTAASGFASGKNREMTMALSGIRANHFHRDLILKIMRAKGAMG